MVDLDVGLVVVVRFSRPLFLAIEPLTISLPLSLTLSLTDARLDSEFEGDGNARK